MLDCSVTMAWVFPDEATEETGLLLDSLLAGRAFVPAIRPIEVGNRSPCRARVGSRGAARQRPSAASGSPRLRSAVRLGSKEPSGRTPLRKARNWPESGSRRIVIGSSVSVSIVTSPSGPESSMLASAPLQTASTGSRWAKAVASPRSETLSMSKERENRVLPSPSLPVRE